MFTPNHRSTTEGLACIKRGEVAALVLAGGAGTRLGFPLPKGLYIIPGLLSQKPLFQLFAERLLRLADLAWKGDGEGGEGKGEGKGEGDGAASVREAANCIPWYIMTSRGDNHMHSVKFFEDNDYFGYPPSQVMTV